MVTLPLFHYLVQDTTLNLSACYQVAVLITGMAICQETWEIHSLETVFLTTNKTSCNQIFYMSQNLLRVTGNINELTMIHLIV